MSSVKPLCKSTELNRCIAANWHWKRKQASRSSPERLPNLHPSSLRNSKDEELKALKFSIAMGWKYGLTTNYDTSQPFALLPFPGVWPYYYYYHYYCYYIIIVYNARGLEVWNVISEAIVQKHRIKWLYCNRQALEKKAGLSLFSRKAT